LNEAVVQSGFAASFPELWLEPRYQFEQIGFGERRERW
jgi:hypothetical protein